MKMQEYPLEGACLGDMRAPYFSTLPERGGVRGTGLADPPVLQIGPHDGGKGPLGRAALKWIIPDRSLPYINFPEWKT